MHVTEDTSRIAAEAFEVVGANMATTDSVG
jgi:hypothetical protein